MKILFIHPPTHNPSGDVRLQNVKSSSPSLGLLQLASIAREIGHKVKFFDRKFDVSAMLAFSPDLVAITAMTNEIKSAAVIAKTCDLMGIETVLGGCHVTAEPYQTVVVYPHFRNVIQGEGEWKFIDFIGGNSERYKSIDDFPDPAFDLIDWSKYRLSPFGTKSSKSIGLVTSRGCFGKCTFCSRKVFGNRFRGYSAKRLIELLNRLSSTFDDFLFYDDLFTGNRSRLLEFCESVINRRYSWSCCSRIDCVDEPTLKLMKRAGCWMIEYGIESGSQEILERMGKNITKQQIIKTLQSTQKTGIVSKGNFILGYLGESKKTLSETIDFAQDIPLDIMQHTFFAPLPGTDCYDTAHDYGTFNASWEATNTFSINFIPVGLRKNDLLNASKKLFFVFYFNPIKWLQLLKKLTFQQVISGVRTFYASLIR